MTIDQLSYVLTMIEGLTDAEPEPEIEYAPVPELPAETIAQIYIDDAEPAPKKSIAEILAAAKKENR